MRDMLHDTCQILRSRRLKEPWHATLLAFHMQGVSLIKKWGQKRKWGVNNDIDTSCMTVKLIFACDWPLHSQILLQFLHCSSGWSVLQIHVWFEHCLKLKPVKWAPPPIFSEKEKRTNNSAGRQKGWEQKNCQILKSVGWCFGVKYRK